MKDCFFFIDESVPEEDRKMSVLCISCQEKYKIDAWFYQGSEDGYGPFNYKCCKCGDIVHSKEESEEIYEEN